MQFVVLITHFISSITDPELNEIARQPSVVIHVPDEKLNDMDAWCLKHHGDV